MGWLRQETSYERRMRELEEEADRIRKNMQMLVKAGAREPVIRTAAPGGLRKRSSVMPSQSALPDDSGFTGDVEPEELPPENAAFPADKPEPGERTLGFGGVASSAPRPERLANYLASGSFGKGGSLSRERRIQRNKAIFMAIVAVIAIFSLYTWLK